MVLQKRLEYGFNGYQVPPTPRAARSATRRVSSWKKPEENNNSNNKQMCAFDLLATVAGKLLQEGGVEEAETVKTEKQIEEEERPSNVNNNNNNICDQGSCNRSFFVSEIISQAPVMDNTPQNETYSGPSSGITVSDCSEKVPVPVLSVDKVKLPFSCKVDDKNSKPITNEAPPKPHVVHNIENNNNNNVKLPFCKDHRGHGHGHGHGHGNGHGHGHGHGQLPLCQDNVDIVYKDDDENSSGVTRTLNKTFKPPPRIGDRRIRRLLASKYWKAGPELNDEVHGDVDEVGFRNRKPLYKRQRSLKDYPIKKRRLYEFDNFSNSDDVVNSEDRSSPPRKESVENGPGPGVGVKSTGGMKTSGLVSKQNPAFQTRDSHVKLKIKSFRVPELFFELPKTATIGSLKRTVMEAMTSVLSGELHVGVMLQGKKIRDDDKTLLQTGIHNKLDALGFTLEPNHLHVSSSLSPGEQSFAPKPDTPKPLIRYTPGPNVANQLVVQSEVSGGSPERPAVTSFGNLIESDHDSAPSPPMENKSGSDSRALVTVPPMNPRALSVVPMRKSKRSEVAQRRIRRPFSVSEVEALVQAVEKLGTGRWRDVKLRAFDNAKHRTYVDLKDKWKTLVHTARISPQQRRGEPVPQELLDRVLAAHAYWSHHQAKQQFKHPPQPETCRLL